MSPFSRPKVAILAGEPEVERRLVAALGDAADMVLIPNDDPENVEYDVLITDLCSDPAGQTIGRPVCAEDEASRSNPRATVLGIGKVSEGWADLTLDEDCTPREIRLACTLLGEVARLRKERDRLAQTHQEVRQLADTDPLTSLPNRRAWDRQLKVRGGGATHGGLWLAIVDLDHFKAVNDRGGLVEGDRILQHAAGTLAGQLRGSDLIARLGGDEFGVLLTGIDERSALAVFDRLRAAVAAQATEPSAGRLTASIGYAHSTEGCSSADLFAAAERGLREAKRAGGNRAYRGEVQASGSAL